MYDSELIIRARRQGQVYELLPVHALAGDFPELFVHDYAHWLNINTGFVEWRPLPYAWTPTSQNWQMRFDGEGMNKILFRGASRLIGLHTPTAKAVSTVLSPLEQAIYIHITLDCETEVLEVRLPRLKLDFFLRKGATQLESKQFRGMTVDSNQSIGTLTGLINKLVLRGNTDSSRSVIILTATFASNRRATTYVYVSKIPRSILRITFTTSTLNSGDLSTTAASRASCSCVTFTRSQPTV